MIYRYFSQNYPVMGTPLPWFCGLCFQGAPPHPTTCPLPTYHAHIMTFFSVYLHPVPTHRCVCSGPHTCTPVILAAMAACFNIRLIVSVEDPVMGVPTFIALENNPEASAARLFITVITSAAVPPFQGTSV